MNDACTALHSDGGHVEGQLSIILPSKMAVIITMALW